MPRTPAAPETTISQEQAEAVSQDTAEIELEKLQRKIAREERKKRREIEAAKQKKAMWLLPTLLLTTMLISWILSRMNFDTQSSVQTTSPIPTVPDLTQPPLDTDAF